MTLLVLCVTGAWGQEVTPDYESYDWSEADATNVIGTHGDITISKEGLGDNGNISGGHYYIPVNQNLKSSDSSWKYFGISATRQIVSISILYCENDNSNNHNIAWVAWGKNVTPEAKTLAHGMTTSAKGAKNWDNKKWVNIDLSSTEAYTIYLSRSVREFKDNTESTISNFGDGKTFNILGIKVWLKPSGPTINSQSMANASYAQGTAAADVTALSVTATASAGTLKYQWFKNTANSTTEPAPTAVTEESSAEGANTYKPLTTADELGDLYYFCKVTDNNGSVYSNIAKVTVAAASAPTAIEVTGNASAARGADAITLTADVTGGVPTPTIQWFQCDDALKTNPVSQGEASTTNTTLNVATATVGTYYFYAVASNSQGNVASDVKTVTIVPKAPTLTAAGTFTDSKTITIAKAEGENETATIQYKIGDGEWTAYNDPFNVTATSTVTAKVVQAGLESAEASATYTKVEIGSLIATLEPGGNPGVDVAIPSFSKNGFTLTNGSSFNYSNYDGFPYNFKVGTADIVVTAPAWATIQAVKVYGFRNGTGTTTVTANTGATISGSNSLQTRNPDGNLSEVLIIADTPAAANTVSFKIGAQSRIMIEVYGSGTNTTTSQAVSATKKYSTFCSVNDLDFTNVDGLEAYVVSSVDETTATIAKVNKVAAGAGLILKKTKNVGEASNFSVPVATSTDNLGSNLMIGVQNEANLSNLKDTDKPKAFILSDGNFSPCSGGTLAAGKAYLFAAAWATTSTTARELTIIEEGAATGINAIDNGQLTIDNDAPMYNLAGQRVNKSYKGVVIVNGKKMLNK